ncbi:hypothetical protein H2200_005918 [Cladophialophora chaetospira]|uniref:DUF7918 domain-containing protein n=1 Tax=Cladophialophora chaetospira TaxID=386627 RepID=A0AA38XA53_9EURO|nr:hypothetical protein H2200_005918 [Cladophialophora chaetospira]
MAIIGNFEVTIAGEGEVLHEYDVAAEDQVDPSKKDASNNEPASKYEDLRARATTVFKYVEAVPGLNFQISYTAQSKGRLPARGYFSFPTTIDGHCVSQPIVTAKDLAKRGPRTTHREGTSDDQNSMTAAEIIAKYQSIGTVKVEVWRRISKGKKNSSSNRSILTGPVPEKALKGKAMDVGVELQAAKPSQKHNVHVGEDLDDYPVATFILFYRSRNALQILGVIPRTPEPVALEDRDPATLTPAELLELVRRQQAQLQAEKVKIKQEKAEANLKRLEGIKREAEVEDDDEISIVTQTRSLVGKPRSWSYWTEA